MKFKVGEVVRFIDQHQGFEQLRQPTGLRDSMGYYR